MLTYQKTLAFGFTGGKFAYWTENFYNKCDIVATFGYGVEVVPQFPCLYSVYWHKSANTDAVATFGYGVDVVTHFRLCEALT